MGAMPSTPCRNSAAQPQDMAKYLFGTFIGEKLFPLTSDNWQKLLELQLHWPAQCVRQACKVFGSFCLFMILHSHILDARFWSLHALPSSVVAAISRSIVIHHQLDLRESSVALHHCCCSWSPDRSIAGS